MGKWTFDLIFISFNFHIFSFWGCSIHLVGESPRNNKFVANVSLLLVFKPIILPKLRAGSSRWNLIFIIQNTIVELQTQKNLYLLVSGNPV